MNHKKTTIILMSFWLVVLSSNALAKLNPFNQAMALTTKYMPEAVARMWETEYLEWRALLLHAGCTNSFQPINQEISASFSLVHDYILDQAILNGELNDEDVKLALQDAAKLHYKIYSAAYRYGYIYRIKVLKKYHPDINPVLCGDVEEMHQKHPGDIAPILPWQHTGSLKGVKWRENIFAMRIINKYFFRSYVDRHQQFGHIVDAQVYTMIENDEKSYNVFSEITQSYAFKSILVRQISEVYEREKHKKLPNTPWVSIYAKKAERWATQAYMQSTISVLKRVEESHPEIYREVKNHMHSYIDLQRNGIDATKAQLQKIVP